MRELLLRAGLVVVGTKRVVVPLFESELGLERAHVDDKVLDGLLADPEVESYRYVMKSVLDDGSQALADLAGRVNELEDRAHNQRLLIALLRKRLRDSSALAQQLEAATRELDAHRRHVQALEGHMSGLQHDIEVLNRALADGVARYGAPGAKTGSSRLRRLYGRLRRSVARPAPGPRAR